jgi:hypothetical protein
VFNFNYSLNFIDAFQKEPAAQICPMALLFCPMALLFCKRSDTPPTNRHGQLTYRCGSRRFLKCSNSNLYIKLYVPRLVQIAVRKANDVSMSTKERTIKRNNYRKKSRPELYEVTTSN